MIPGVSILSEGHSRTALPRFLQVSRGKCQINGGNFFTAWRGWIVSVLADHAGLGAEQLSCLANISTNKAGWPSMGTTANY